MPHELLAPPHVTPEDIWRITARQAALYTGGASSSVHEETARRLAESVAFTLRTGFGAAGHEGPGLDADALFARGVRRLRRRMAQAKALLGAVQASRIETANLAYNDTLAGLPEFFRTYDLRFFAQDIPCYIDYPLCNPPAPDALGAGYICAYLQSLLLENQLLARFDKPLREAAFAAYTPLYAEELINLYTIFVEGMLRERLRDSVDGSLGSHTKVELARTAEELATALVLPPSGRSYFMQGLPFGIR